MVSGSSAGARGGRFALVCSVAVAALFVLVLVCLFALACASTSFITFDNGAWGAEHTFFLPDSIVLNLAAVAACAACAWALAGSRAVAHVRRRLADDAFFRRCKVALLVLLALVACVWIAATLAVPGADQRRIQIAALASLDGTWTKFRHGHYMNMFPHQVGYFWVSRLFSRFFGDYASAVLQVFNVAGLVVAVESLSGIAGKLGAGRLQQLATIALCAAFFPLVQCCSFVYGTMWGLGLSLAAIRLEMGFFRTWRWRYALGAAACVALAIAFKSNYKVAFIAMGLYALAQLVDSRKLAVLGLVALMAVGYVAQAQVPVRAVEQASGYQQEGGMSSYSWVAMGLQESSEMAPGWYTGYNVRTFEESGFDAQAQERVAKADIAQSLEDFASGDRDALRFFVQKTASEWNNPTFQGFWNVQRRQAAFELLPPVAWAMSAQGIAVAAAYLNLLQAAVLAGALAWVLLQPWRRKGFQHSLVLPLMFLGGFACHLVWEAKCQYVLPYFALLLPFAIMGYAQLGRALRRRAAVHRVGPRKALVLAVSVVAVAAVLAAGGYAAVTGDVAEYAAWLATDPTCPLVGSDPLLGT